MSTDYQRGRKDEAAEQQDAVARLDDLLNELLKHAPPCWDGDAAADYIAVDYVRHLERIVKEKGQTALCRYPEECCDA